MFTALAHSNTFSRFTLFESIFQSARGITSFVRIRDILGERRTKCISIVAPQILFRVLKHENMRNTRLLAPRRECAFAVKLVPKSNLSSIFTKGTDCCPSSNSNESDSFFFLLLAKYRDVHGMRSRHYFCTFYSF